MDRRGAFRAQIGSGQRGRRLRRGVRALVMLCTAVLAEVVVAVLRALPPLHVAVAAAAIAHRTTSFDALERVFVDRDATEVANRRLAGNLAGCAVCAAALGELRVEAVAAQVHVTARGAPVATVVAAAAAVTAVAAAALRR